MVAVSFDGATAAKLQDALASHEASKEYLCVVRGSTADPDAAGYPRDNPPEDIASMRREMRLDNAWDCHRPLTDKDSPDKKTREAHTTFRCVTSFTVCVEEEYKPHLANAVDAADPRVTLVEGCEGVGVQVLRRDIAASVLVARLYTGRRHQIRRHLQHAAMNLLGDTSYGKGRINSALRIQHGLPRMLLHAWRLTFRHPITGQLLHLQDPVPLDMDDFLAKVENAPSANELQRLLAALPNPIQPVGNMPPRSQNT